MTIETTIIDNDGDVWRRMSERQRRAALRDMTGACYDKNSDAAKCEWRELRPMIRASLPGHAVDGVVPEVRIGAVDTNGCASVHIGTGPHDSILHIDLSLTLVDAMIARWHAEHDAAIRKATGEAK